MSAELSRNSVRAYESGWRAFQKFCADANRESLPAATRTLTDYVLWNIEEGRRLQTISVRLSAINYHHRLAGLPSPIDGSVTTLLSCARRDLKERPAGRHPLTLIQLQSILSKYSDADTIDVRNRAILLLLYAAGWRRSELAPLDLEDVRFHKKGLTLFQAFSKTDQQAKGRFVAINHGEHHLTCPVRALKAWLVIRGDWPGPLFVRFAPGRTTITHERLNAGGDVVYRLVKAALERIGTDASNYGAHSLRAGMITTSAENGADPIAIMQRTGHKDFKTVMDYIRPIQAFQRDPLAGVL